jgi:hypothetical protein
LQYFLLKIVPEETSSVFGQACFPILIIMHASWDSWFKAVYTRV